MACRRGFEGCIGAKSVHQVGQSGAPGLAHGRIAAGQPDVPQVRAPFKAAVASHQKLAAPNGAVGAVSRAVEGHPDGIASQAVFGHAGSDVGVMVLHADHGQALQPQRVFGAEIARVQVVRDGSRRHAKQLFQIGQRLFEEPQGFVILQVANVLAQDGVASLGEAEGVFQLAAAGQQLGRGAAQVESLRSITARPAQHALAAFESADHRIVGAHVDAAIMREEPVGHVADSFLRLAVVHYDGLFADIAAGHHQRIESRAVEEQVVQQRIRQHDAQDAIPRRDGLRQLRRQPARQQDDGPPPTGEGRAVRVGHFT